MATSSNTFKVIRDPNRPIQIDRPAFNEAILPRLSMALDNLERMDLPNNAADFTLYCEAVYALRTAIDALQQEAGATQ